MDSLFKRIETEWRNSLRLNALFNSVASALVFGAFALRLLSEIDALVMCLTSLVVFFTLFYQRNQITIPRIIHELNRRPECEHSAELLLNAPEKLPFLARLQQRKVSEWLEQNVKEIFPKRWQKKLLWLGASLLGSMLIVAFPKKSLEQPHSPEQPLHEIAAQLTIEKIEVQIEPPAYTLKPKRFQDSLNIFAEENATVRWTLKLSRACKHVSMAMVSGDTLRFKQESERIYSAEMKATQSQAYSLLMDEWASEIATMEVQKDFPPVVSVLSPSSRTEFSSPDSARLFIKIAIGDDYKTRKVNLVLTSAKGRGEAVKFNSDTLRLRPTATFENGIEQYQTTLDLKKYELTYGDECYFFVEAFDNREPKPNATRTETYVVKILDTLQVLTSENIEMPVLRLPTYFRSQRQIIIDTEKLIAEKNLLEPGLLRMKSENLGIEQKVLRMRYGKFLGEELAISIGETQNEQLAKTMHDTSTNPIVKLQKQAAARAPKADDGHDHDQKKQTAQPIDALIEPYMHRHDLEESATFFSEPIKQKLKATLAQMWEAEKFLRLVQPERALPFEYKALQLLKEVQQEARAYVEKSGFEPTPIDEAQLRLTGENTKIKSSREMRWRQINDSLKAIKNALSVLNERKKIFSSDELKTLQEAGKCFAQFALEKNLKELSALQAIRRLIDDAKSGKTCSEDDLRRVQRAFFLVLPLPNQLPNSQSTGYSILAKRYFQLLNEKR
ncbi:MAG: hypothetical protein ACUVRP_01950 [Chlorobiales bacterium]